MGKLDKIDVKHAPLIAASYLGEYHGIHGNFRWTKKYLVLPIPVTLIVAIAEMFRGLIDP